MSRVRIPGRSRHIQITRREILGTSDALSILKLTSPPPPSNVDLASGFTSGMAAFKFLEHDDTKLHLFVSASMHCKNQNIKSNEKSINKIAKNRCRALKQDIDVCIKITIQTRPQQYNWKKKIHREKKWPFIYRNDYMPVKCRIARRRGDINIWKLNSDQRFPYP